MGSVHVSVTAACHEYFEKYRRHVYVTPKSYLSFLAGYRQLYEKKLGRVRGMAQSIAGGLAKMNEAKVDVNRMKVKTAIAVMCYRLSTFPHVDHFMLTTDWKCQLLK